MKNFGLCRTSVNKSFIIRVHGMSNISTPLHQDLRNCASALGKWGQRQNIELRQNINKVRHLIKVAYDRPLPLDFSLIHQLERQLDSLLEKEEIYWKQWARENWLKWGDRNTKWFHQKATSRRRLDGIHGVETHMVCGSRILEKSW